MQYSPANDPYVITVGGVDENGTADPSDDTVASWSSQGTTQDGVQKPDVYAPGAHIVSVLAPNSEFANSNCDCLVAGGQYIQTSGTSMAAPMIVGPGGRPAPGSPALDARPGQGRPDQPRGERERVAPGAERGQGGAQLEPAGGRPGAHAEQADQRPPRATSTPRWRTWNLATWNRANGALRAGYADSSYTLQELRGQAAATAVNSSLATWGLGTWGIATWNTASLN